MRTRLIFAVVLGMPIALFAALAGRAPTEAADEENPLLAHNVYFSLKDNAPSAKKKLVDACKKYLSKHEGEVYFAAGPIADEYKREVNDRDFDVALTIVFKNAKAHDQYQDAKRHLQFIAENKAAWKKVRVFVNEAREPCLVVERLGGCASGRVGLWVDSKDGAFANLKVVPTK